MSDSLQPYGLWPARLLCPWDSVGRNAGVGCRALLQGVFPTQGSAASLTSPALAAGFTSATTCIYAFADWELLADWELNPCLLCLLHCKQILYHWATGKPHMCLYICVCIYTHRRCKRCTFDPWVMKIPWRRAGQPTPVFLPEESHGQRSLAGYRP